MNIYHPEDKMRCPIHFCLGQEALASCTSLLLKKMIMCYLTIDLMVIIWPKSPVDKMISEFYGKKDGSNFGLADLKNYHFLKLIFTMELFYQECFQSH